MRGIWQVTGILDWEFAHLGSVWWGVTNMLRYAHKMPPVSQTAFTDALAKNGVELPSTWYPIVHLLNLLSLLDYLKRSEPQSQPNRCHDIIELIEYILLALESRYIR